MPCVTPLVTFVTGGVTERKIHGTTKTVVGSQGSLISNIGSINAMSLLSYSLFPTRKWYPMPVKEIKNQNTRE